MSMGIRTDVKSFDDVRKALGQIDRVLAGDGTVNTIQRDGTQVGDKDIEILDFDTMFTLTESPDRDIDITIRPASLTQAGISRYTSGDFTVSGGVVSLDTSVVQSGIAMIGDLDLGDNNILNVGYIDMSEITPPASPAADTLRLYVEDFKGFSFFSFVDSTGMVRRVVRDSVFVAKNDTLATIAIGQPVYATGSSGNVPTIDLADSDNLATMPSIGITAEAIAPAAFGRVMQVGMLENFDTSAFVVGDQLFVASGGGLTATAPLWPNLRQEVGTVLVVGVGNGSIQCVARSMFNEGILDHGGLLGLADDDHTQYLLADGTRNVSGDMLWSTASEINLWGPNNRIYGVDANNFALDAGTAIYFEIGSAVQIVLADGAVYGNVNNDIDLGIAGTNEFKDAYFAGDVLASTYESDVVTGTAPFTVASTTVVPNLNVDQVDGKDSTDLVLVDGTQALTANWDAGAFEIRAQTFESDVATGTAPFTVASTTVSTNLNADMLDGKHTGTSGNVVPLLDGANTWSGVQTMSGATKLEFRDANTDIYSIVSGVLVLDASTQIFLAIGGTTEAVCSSTGFTVTNVLTCETLSVTGDAGGSGTTFRMTNVTAGAGSSAPTFINVPTGATATQHTWLKAYNGTVGGYIPFFRIT